MIVNSHDIEAFNSKELVDMAEAEAIIPNRKDDSEVEEVIKGESISSWGFGILKSVLKVAQGKATDNVIGVIKRL